MYVGQVDYAATPEELLAHFEACGTVERITIVCDKLTGRPKGMCWTLILDFVVAEFLILLLSFFVNKVLPILSFRYVFYKTLVEGRIVAKLELFGLIESSRVISQRNSLYCAYFELIL